MNGLLTYVNDSDFRVNHRLVSWRAPRWFRVLMITATHLGDGWLWFATPLLLLVGVDRGLRVLYAAAVTAAVANGLLVMLKRIVRRPRPCEADLNPHLSYRPRFAGDGFSFPSGHALNAFAVVTVAALVFPALALPVFLIGAAVAASRVYLGFHYVTDVVVGAALGATIAVTVFAAVNR